MLKKYKPFLEEISIKGNSGVPGESGDNKDPKYLSNVDRRARTRLGDQGRPLPEGDMRLIQRVGMEIMNLASRSMEITRGREKELEDLAKEVILSQYGTILDGVELDIKLVRPGEPNRMMDKPEESDEDEMPTFRVTNDPDLKKEVDKAKLLNNIIQGEAKNTKHMLHMDMIKDRLNSIFGENQGREIFNIWDKISKLADRLDWMIPVSVRAEMMEEQPMGQAGAVKVEWNKKKTDEDKNDLADKLLKSIEDGDDLSDNEEDISELFDETTPKIKAVGIDFPMLLHETVKGIYELIAAHSIPDDEEFAKKIKANVTSLEDEAEDWKYGPEMASDLRDYVNSVIEEMSKTDSRISDIENLREFFFGRIVDRNYMSTDDFLSLFRSILKNDPAVKNKCKSIISEIVKELRDFYKSQPLPFEMDDHNEDDNVLDRGEEEIKEAPKSKKADYTKMSKVSLQREIDNALDSEDYDLVRQLTEILNDKYPEK